MENIVVGEIYDVPLVVIDGDANRAAAVLLRLADF